jgi:hypothetical protein
MNTEQKITEIVDEYCADHEDKILARVDLRNGRSVHLTLSDFERIYDALDQS